VGVGCSNHLTPTKAHQAKLAKVGFDFYLAAMERKPVKSSMAKSIGHDPFRSILEIEFTSGEIWQYFNVPDDVYREMLTFSIGKYFKAFIKGKYNEKRVE
jgi:hypothetical protein